MMKQPLMLSVLAMLLCWACQKEHTTSLQQDEHNYFVPNLDDFALDRSACDWTTIPAGSHNALAQAIADACVGGVIYLKSGEHTESGPVVIGKPVKIIGEAGAVLKIHSDLSTGDTLTGLLPIYPALHVLDAPGTLIQDLDIRPLGTDGGAAILYENSPQSATIRCTITGFQFSVVVEKSDRMAIMRNTIVSSGAWQTGQVPQAHGIVVANGKSAYVSDNDVSNALFGIWACDRYGTCERNTTHANYIGIILCKVPTAFQLPSGEITGSEFPATLWKARQNQSHGNFSIGYLVIDGANGNLLEDNDAGDNAAYDYELTTDTYRFGFLTPFAYNNIVYAKPGQTVKDCGMDNTIVGGEQVDTSVDLCQ